VISAVLLATADRRYIALSHCWGDPNEIPQTRKESLAEHMQRIPPIMLSKTFQDAIVVTKELGIQYLGIHSLCIVQRARQDFESECSDMHNIYRSTYCILSALDAIAGSGGSFIPRQPGRRAVECP
jgi:hypothetical protein